MAGGATLQVLQLRGRLDVEEQYPLSHAGHELVLGLADPREDDLLRVETGLHRPVELTAGDDVRPRSKGRQSTQNSEVTVRLDREADHVVQTGEGLVQLPVGPL